MGGHHSAKPKSETWLTPPKLIEAFGPFDLDPCAAPSPRPWPTAKRHIELPEDGFTADWGDSFVWLNPPYTTKEATRWMRRMADHNNGIALMFARTETKWFVESIWERATALLFLHGPRLHFHRPDGTRAKNNSGAPSVLIAYGVGAAYRLMFSDLGHFVLLKDLTPEPDYALATPISQDASDA